jgi:hypothetical protein
VELVIVAQYVISSFRLFLKNEEIKMKKHIFFALTLFVCLMVVVVVYAQKAKQAEVQKKVNQTTRSSRLLAKIKGFHLFNATPVGVPNYENIQSLTRDSEVIVVGTPLSSSTILRQPQEIQIITKYRINVSRVIKGDIKNKREIMVNVAGGRIQFEDGTIAEMKMPDGWKTPQIGKNYTFFLMERKKDYALVGGPQGLFEITEANKIESQAQSESQLLQKYQGKSIELFLSEIDETAN